jgi:hypothetical protein
VALPELLANSPTPGASGAETTLAAAVTDPAATSISVAAAARPVLQAAGQFRLEVDSEVMLVTGGSSTTTWTVVRGVEGSTAATHASGAPVYHVWTVGALDARYTLAGSGFNAGIYGDGSDGAIALDGTTSYTGFSARSGSIYTLHRDVFASSLTISAGVTVITSNCILFSQTSITNNGTIQNNGNNGSGSNGAGTTNLGSGFSSVGSGGGGGAGQTTAGSAASPIGYRVACGNGGNGGAGSSGAGGAGVGANVTPSSGIPLWKVPSRILAGAVTSNSGSGNVAALCGSGGGGGGGGDSTNKGGGGGGGGGLVILFSPTVINNGVIQAIGGNGAAGVAGNSGGGGAGGGGVIAIYTQTAWTAGTTSVVAGTVGAGSGTGAAGVAGTVGSVINVLLC